MDRGIYTPTSYAQTVFHYTAPPEPQPAPSVENTTPHTALLACQLCRKKNHEEYLVVICNKNTQEKRQKKLSENNQKIEFADLYVDSQYIAYIVACDKKSHDVTTDGESLLFSTPGTCIPSSL